MKIIEYISYVITLVFICIVIFHWIKNKILPWKKIGFTFDSKITFNIIAGLGISGIIVSFIFFVDCCFGFTKIKNINAPNDIFLNLYSFFLRHHSFKNSSIEDYFETVSQYYS